MKKNSMKWVGLTGGIGSGKSTVAEILRDLGHSVVDADQIARDVVQTGSPGLRSVVQRFGPQILDPTGKLDRKKLGEAVFSQPQALKDLEGILHPLIKLEAAKKRNALEEKGLPFAFYDVPLLFEQKMQSQFDLIVVVAASVQDQKKRIQLRDRLSDEEVEKRLSAQMPLSEKEKAAGFVIQNSGPKSDLETQVRELIKILKH